MSNCERDYCRLCAGFQPNIKIIELQNNEKKCQDIVKKLSRFNIVVNFNDNELPKVVCITCVTSLERAYNFVAAVEQGQLAINNLISVLQIKQESDQELFSDFKNCSYEVGSLNESSDDDDADIKKESKNDSYSTLSTSENIHNNEDVSDDHVYAKNGKSESVNTCKSAPLKSEHKDKSNNVDLKSGNAKQSNKSISDDNNFNYILSTDGDYSVSKSAPSNTKNCEKSIQGKKQCYRRNSLPSSELELSWDDYNWICSYCETQFTSCNELRTHSMQFHNACNPYFCIDCKMRKLHLNSFIVHVKRHRQYLKFSCYKCPMKFRTLVQAAQHREVHMSSDFICFGCNMNFSSQTEWFKHTNMFYKNSRAPSMLAFQGDSLTCYICAKTYKTKNQLNNHLLMHSNNILCEICGKSFYPKSSLAAHLASHSDERPFQCEICTSRFKTLRRLKLHIATHDGNKPFSCDICEKCFRLKSHLVSHMIIHTDNLPHACTYCNKRFRNKGLLNQHIRQHTGVKPYSCDICKRDFTNWPNYNKHMKRRHDMNMSKKKRTPAGPFPIDPNTGEVICPSEKKITQWRQKNMELINAGRKRVAKSKKSNNT